MVLMGQGVAHVRATGMAHTDGLRSGPKPGAIDVATVLSTVQSQISNREN